MSRKKAETLKTETLLTCPGCGTPNFTPRGLKAHVCKGINRKNSPRPAAETDTAAVHTADAAPGTLSKNGAQPVALVDLNVPQLAEACHMLEQCQERYDKLSGICATMRGFVLMEVKRKLAHGKFLPWLKDNFGKTRKTAAEDMRVARECGKCRPKVTFETLGRDLAATIKELEGAQIDLEHPLVKEIAGWVGSRTRYQLLLEFPGERGGANGGRRKKLSPEEEHAQFLDDCREAFATAVTDLDGLNEKALWKAPSITDAMRADAADLFAQMAKDLRAFNQLPAGKRAEPEIAS